MKIVAAVIDPRDTYFVASTTSAKADIENITASGLMARATPRPVATPFPPLNPKNGLNILPAITAIPMAGLKIFSKGRISGI